MQAVGVYRELGGEDVCLLFIVVIQEVFKIGRRLTRDSSEEKQGFCGAK